jgi:hypothetical protein
MNPVQFYDHIGEEILILIPRIDPKVHQRMKLVGVEQGGGLWLEIQQLTNHVLESIKAASAPKTPVFFVPFHEIAVAILAASQPSLNEKAFGL